MVVEQEMAEIYPPEAEDLSEYLPDIDCGSCGYKSCIEFAEALLEKKIEPQKCPELDPESADLLAAVIALNKDPIPYNLMMEKVPCELIEIGQPDKNAPLLITCNFQETVRIMKEILEKTSTPAFLLPTFTHGYSVDNAVHEKFFKAMEIWKAIKESAVEEKLQKPIMVIPGLAESEKNSIRQLTRWEVLVGPESGFLLPLFIANNKEEFLS
jgi:acetyl-CoA decarbonylase/synthase complex subunit gamma